MKRKLLLFSLLLALMAPWTANAQTTVEIGDGTGTTYYFPIDNYFNYSCTEQIYTAEEIGTAGNITAVSFYYNYGTAYAANNVTMYMKNVDRSNFSATTDCEALALGDIVWTGSIAPTEAGWYTFVLDTPFEYDGTSNLLVAFFDGTSGYPGTAYTWRQTTSPNNAYMALRYYSDGTCPDPYNLSSYSGSKQYYTYRSNIQIEITPGSGPTCARPDEVIAENITTNSATILWTGGSGTYNVEYKKTTDETWTSAITNTTETSVELTGLTPGTNYQAKVQSVCVFDDTTMYRDRSVNFATSFGIPLIEPFATTTFPTGWSRYTGLLSDVMNGTALTTTTSGWLIGNYNNVFDTHTRVNIYGTTCKYWLVTPTLLMEDNVELSFDLALTVYTSGSSASPTPGNQADDRFVVLITTDGGATWEILREWNNTGSEYVYDNITNASTGQYETIDLSSYAGQNIAVAFYGQSTVSGGDNNLHVDNISIDYIPSCPKPSGLAYSEVTGHTALLTWTPNGVGQTQWQICLNGDEENLIPVTSTDGTYTLTGLTGVTPYTVKVRAYCSEEDQSPWSNQVSFTTDVTCVAPTAFAVSDVTNRNVKLNWTSEGTDWIVAYKLTSAGDDTYVEVPVTENPFILEGLAPETGYTVRVRNNCGEVDGLSTWSATRTFTTLVAYPAPINVAVDSVFAYTAYLSWTERGTAMDWEVAYKLATDTVYTLSELTPDNHPFLLGELDPLTPGTDYVCKVRSIYFTEQGDTASAWSNEVPFTTLLTCPAPTELTVIDSTINAYGATLTWNAIYSDSYNVMVIPYEVVIETMVNTGFEDNEIPSAFTNSTSYPWTVTEGGANGSSYCAIPGNIGVNSSSSDLTFVVTGPASVSFNAKVSSESNWDYGRFLVDGSQRMQISGTQDWTAYSYELTEGEHTLVWRYYKDSSGASGNDLFYVDDIIVAGSSIVMLEGFNYPAEEATITLNDLQPETHYIVKVTSHCGEEMSEESETVTFTTKPSCLAPTDLVVIDSTITAHTATLSWTENGSATEWVIKYTAIVNDSTTVMDSINVTENPYMLTGLLDGTPYTAKVQAYCSATDQSDWSNTVRFVTPIACPAPTELAVDSITTEGATLTWNGTSESYVVMIGEPDPENLVEGTMLNVNFDDQVIPSSWTNSADYPFTVVDGHIQSSNAGIASSSSSISFTMTFDSNVTLEFDAECRGEGTSTYYDHCDFYIDNARQIYAGANISGWNHYTYNVAAGEHTFLWSYTKDTSVDPSGDYFAVDNIMITGLIPTPSNWTEYPAEESPYTFENLEPGTTYFVQVQSNCEGEQPYVSSMISFTTVASCVAPTEVEVTDVAAHTATMVWIGDNDSYLVNLGVNEPIILESADFAEEIPSTWTNSSDYPWAIVNGYMQTTNAGVGSSTSSISTTVTFPAEGTIEFDAECMGEGTSTYWDHCDFYIDGTRVLYHGAELGSGWNHYTYEVTAGEHTFTWSYTKDSSVNPTGDYFAVDNVAMKVSNIIWNEEPYAAADTTYTFNELLAEHTYYTQVQGVCGDEYSEWSEIISFTTTVACPAPINLAIANVTDSITGHTATINWIETGLATAWEICLNNDENNLIPANDTIITLTDLAQDADYTVKVRANCGELDGTSAWSNTVTFHTLVTCVAPTNLTVDNIGTESATLMWEGESDSYLVQYVPYNQIGEDQTSTGVLTTYTYDLSEFEGMGTIVIRHYDVSDLFRLNVDDIMVTDAQGDTIFSEDFEGTVSSQLSIMDRDGDGYNWYLDSSTGVDAQGNPYCNGSNFITSASYDNSVGALEPDNWLIISGVELGGQLTFVARAQDPEWSAENFAVFVSPEEGAGEETVEGDNMLDLWDLTPNTSYAWQVQGICGEDVSQWATSFFTTMDDVLVFVTDGDWDNVDNWDPAELPTTDKNVRIEANAIIPAGLVAEANKVTIEEGGSITIKDGGQLKQNSATLQVTMEKEITGYDEGTGNFYLISSPFTGRTQFGESTWNHVENLIDGTYDLYTFDPTYGEGEEWVNYKDNSAHIAYQSEAQGNAGLFEEVGYLYANQDTITLNFIGKTGKSNNASTEPKALVNDSINKGWALVGNYFACNAYLTVVDSLGEPVEANCYVMNATGDNLELAATTDGIAPLSSVFVYLETSGYYQLNSEMPAPAKFNRTGKFIMNLSQGSENVDQVVVRFGKGRNLEKMSLNNSKLYFSMMDKDYAVVYSRNEANMPVSFKAETAGSYTINFAAEGVSFKELVLIDNATETKVDLLANPSYTFETEAGNFAERFTIIYTVK